MANPPVTSVQSLLPVQAYFDVYGTFQTFIGQGVPFYATTNPSQSGLNITNSTINSTTIGATTPSTGVFTNIATTTGTITTAPSSATDIANKQYVDYYAAGLSWKQPVKAASLSNIASLSGFQTVDTVPLTNGDRVLVKNQSLSQNNGIYVVRTGAWEYAVGADNWEEYVGAIVFVEEGSQAYTAWYSLAQEGGTLGVTSLTWANFSVATTYSAGTGLTLSANVFSITNTGVTAATYGSASSVPVIAINAQGQATSVTNTSIAISATQITSGTIDSARLSGSYTGITGLGTLTDLTVTNAIVGSITGNAATATSANSATTATNLTGGASGNVPYQTASGATTFLATGSNGQVLTLASGVPSWATPTTGTVTSVSGSGTVSGISLSGTVTSTGSLTLGGTLDLSAPPAIGGTTPNSGAFTTVTASSSLTTPTVQATNSGGLALKNSVGTTQISMGGGGGDNVSINVATNINGANAQIDISPTGTGHVHIKPTGTGSLEIAPTNAGTMNNMVIGGTTPLAGTFTDLRFNNTLSLAGSTGTAGYVVTSNGASAPTWQALPASGITITDDTTTNATRYLTFTSATSGTINGANTSSTKLQFNPSTGTLTTVDAIFNGTTAVTLPSGTTGQRPSSPTNGMLRFNTTIGAAEVYSATNGWEILNTYTVVPGAPTIGTATATSSTSATVTYTAPASNGGSVITSYTAVASPGGQTGTVSQAGSGTITVTGLTTGTAYTFTVFATNLAGNSASSAASNSITTWSVPDAPTSVSATNTGVGIQSVAFTAPAYNGGTAITGYTVTRSPGGSTFTGASSPISATGGANNTSYTYTVTATNAVGTGAASSASSPVTTYSVPGAPTIGTATATGNTTATVSYTAPASNGGTAITSYTAVSTPGSITGTLSQAGSGTITVSGLSGGTAYTFVVYATNAVGNSANSAASNSITTTNKVGTVDYAVVAGGGGGGRGRGGGGGAGGMQSSSIAVSSGSPITVTVGGGGGQYSTGSNSVFSSVTSNGGGLGGSENGFGGSNNGGSGGSGGGSAYQNSTRASGTSGQGNAGGQAMNQGNYGGGGGGGKSANGQDDQGGDCGAGGAGASVSAALGGGTYAGGGGGGGNGGAGGAGGSGGGGAGKTGAGQTGDAGTANTGGGGGGGAGTASRGNGGAGGSGIVIIAYSNTFDDAVSTTGSPSYVNTGGYKRYTWTSSGSITF